jgi:hypothetical protein
MSFLKNIFGGNKSKEPPHTEATGAAPPPPEPEPQPIRISELTPYELKARLDNGDELVVVDMRQAWEYEAGHIPGANFPKTPPLSFNVGMVTPAWMPPAFSSTTVGMLRVYSA